jgi:two-component system nitrogen regulation sensor histidine kinase NtrY
VLDDGLLVADLVLAVALVGLLAGRLTQIWLDRRRGAAGSRLHMRLVLMCGLFTVMPTLVVAIIIALLFVNFTDFVVKPSRASFEAARASASRSGARERPRSCVISRRSPPPCRNRGSSRSRTRLPSPRRLKQLIGGRAMIEADVVHADKGLIARAVAPGDQPLANPVPGQQFLWQTVNHGAPIQLDSPRGAYFVMQLFVAEPYFLVTGHAVDLRGRRLHQEHRARRQVLLPDRDAAGAGPAHHVPDLRRHCLPDAAGATGLAILFATHLTAPIGGLMSAAEQMRGGDLSVRVEEGPPNDELGQLARSFKPHGQPDRAAAPRADRRNKELDTRRG